MNAAVCGKDIFFGTMHLKQRHVGHTYVRQECIKADW